MAAQTTKVALILSDPVIDAICKALGVAKDRVSRITLDLTAGRPIAAEITMFGTEDFSVIDWAAALKGAKFSDIE